MAVLLLAVAASGAATCIVITGGDVAVASANIAAGAATGSSNAWSPSHPSSLSTAICCHLLYRFPGGLGAGPSGLTRPPLGAPDRALVRED